MTVNILPCLDRRQFFEKEKRAKIYDIRSKTYG